MTGLLHDCIVKAARSRPDARAVIGEDGSSTYAELDAYSNRLASLLLDQGCERGHPVVLAGGCAPEIVSELATAVDMGGEDPRGGTLAGVPSGRGSS